MCDEDTVNDNDQYRKNAGTLSRRQFNALTAGTALTMMLPKIANAMAVVESNVSVRTADGVADCVLIHPTAGKHAAVIIWPDILGLRTSLRLMGKRLAESGYSVLVVNPYYRAAAAPIVLDGASFRDETTRNKILPMAMELSADTTTIDAHAFVSFLDQHTSVDTERKIGTAGYCMGGPFTMITAAAIPHRIGAGASFHGARLVTDKTDSPHLMVPKMNAHFLFAIAANDDERDPDVKVVLQDSYDKAGLPAEIEVYEGALHGWCPPDSSVYNEFQAERAWSRLLTLFDTALG